MATYMAIDIETVYNEEKDKFLPQIEADKRLKDPDKIEADIINKRDKQKPDLALDPNWGKIICVCTTDSPDPENAKIICDPSIDEETNLKTLWKYISELHYPKFITFNGNVFDIPYLLRRTWFRQVKPIPPFFPDTQRYRSINHYDLYAILNHGDTYRKKGSLGFYAHHLLGRKLSDGRDVWQWWQDGNFVKITDHCREDVAATWALWQSMQGYYPMMDG